MMGTKLVLGVEEAMRVRGEAKSPISVVNANWEEAAVALLVLAWYDSREYKIVKFI